MREMIGRVFFVMGMICFIISTVYAAFFEIWFPVEKWGWIFLPMIFASLVFVATGAALNPQQKQKRRCGLCHRIIPDSFGIGCPNCDRH